MLDTTPRALDIPSAGECACNIDCSFNVASRS
jgi:hypothetical protein